MMGERDKGIEDVYERVITMVAQEYRRDKK